MVRETETTLNFNRFNKQKTDNLLFLNSNNKGLFQNGNTRGGYEVNHLFPGTSCFRVYVIFCQNNPCLFLSSCHL